MASDLDAKESPAPPPKESLPPPPPPTKATIEDILLWQRKRLNAAAIVTSTVVWVALEIYGFTFVTVASWVAMFVVSSVFIWGNIDRLLRKESPDLSWMFISEKSAEETANAFRHWANQGVAGTMRLGTESRWHVFAAAMASLWLLSVVSSHFDFITILYIGELAGLTLPVTYVKYEQKIKECGRRLKVQSGRYYSMILQKSSELTQLISEKTGFLKNRMSEPKEKKME